MRKLIVAVFCICLSAHAFQLGGGCSTNKYQNKSGWRIPGLGGIQSTQYQHAKWGTGEIEGLYVDLFNTKWPDQALLLNGDAGGAVTLRQVSVDVTEVMRFVINGHTFAYRIKMIPVAIDAKRRRHQLGTEEIVVYYDLDGSGRYTQMRNVDAMEPFVPVIPEWARRK